MSSRGSRRSRSRSANAGLSDTAGGLPTGSQAPPASRLPRSARRQRPAEQGDPLPQADQPGAGAREQRIAATGRRFVTSDRDAFAPSPVTRTTVAAPRACLWTLVSASWTTR